MLRATRLALGLSSQEKRYRLQKNLMRKRRNLAYQEGKVEMERDLHYRRAVKQQAEVVGTGMAVQNPVTSPTYHDPNAPPSRRPVRRSRSSGSRRLPPGFGG